MSEDSDKKEARKSRGQIDSDDLEPFKNSNHKELFNMITDKNPQIRTISATLLNKEFIDNLDDENIIINKLANSFKDEKALYTRIAISNSLVSYGELAVPSLIQLLGQIGNNHEKRLPKKYFNKKSFPLPRDLAARTLTKMGDIPTPFLIDVLNENYSNFVKEQAIDAIGAIAYKYDDHRAFNTLKNLSEFFKDTSPFISWKIIRSLSGFKHNNGALKLVIKILEYYYSYIEIKWEAIRSIGQINISNNDVKNILNNLDKENNLNNNPQIKLALTISRNNLKL